MPWTFYDKYGQKRAIGGGLSANPQLIFDVQVARGNTGDPATGATVIDSNTILGGNIPSTFKHLLLDISARSGIAGTSDSLYARFNNDSAGNYDWFGQYGQNASGGIATSAFAQTGGFVGYIGGSSIRAARFTSFLAEIYGYADSVREKSVLSKYGFTDTAATTSISGTTHMSWRSTAAVTRIQLLNAGGSVFTDGSRFTLYGMP